MVPEWKITNANGTLFLDAHCLLLLFRNSEDFPVERTIYVKSGFNHRIQVWPNRVDQPTARSFQENTE